MTTIATDGKSMAGDGQREVCGTITTWSAQKVRRLKDGSVIGTCGDVAFGYALVEWLNDDGEKPEPKVESSFNALRMMPSGELILYDQHGISSPIDTPFAIGSGMDLAIGAMLAGESPVEAVEIAASRDPGTGGKIIVLHLETAWKAVA